MPRALPQRSTLLACLALGLLALAAEIAGIGAIQRLDVGRHVSTRGHAQADFYPPLLAALKVGAALLAARLAWRFARARALERAGLRLLGVVGGGRAAAPARPRPRVRLELSPRLWCAAFVLTSAIYVVQADVEGLETGAGRWPLLAPLLHTSALPVFAVLAVVVALAWRAVAGWLCDYEHHARETLEQGRRLAASLVAAPVHRPMGVAALPVLRLLVSSLHQRPPPLLPA